MARYNRKRTRELQHDVFRDKTLSAFDRLADRFEGQGRTLLYAVAGLFALALLFGMYSWYSGRKAEEARRALGRAIEIAAAPVAAAPAPAAVGVPPAPSFTTEKERAQRAVEEFQKVEAKYSDPYKSLAHYFRAANLLVVDHPRGLSELEAISKSGSGDVAARAKFALAQAREADAQYDQAATLYNELLRDKSTAFAPDTLNLRLAMTLEKQGKQAEAADALFKLVQAARKAQDKDGKAVPPSAAAREAAQKLQTLDSARYAQLPSEPVSSNLPF